MTITKYADEIALVPTGFVAVTKEQFFTLLSKAAAIDPMPNDRSPNYTTWETQRGLRFAWGWSTPGWRNPGDPAQYAVRADFVTA